MVDVVLDTETANEEEKKQVGKLLYLTKVNVVLVDVTDGAFFQSSRVPAKVVIPAFLSFENLLETRSVPGQASMTTFTVN